METNDEENGATIILKTISREALNVKPGERPNESLVALSFLLLELFVLVYQGAVTPLAGSPGAVL